MIKAVFFDVGSTLLYPSPDVPTVYNKVVADWGYSFDYDEIDSHMPAVWDYYEQEVVVDSSFWADDERSHDIWVNMYALLSKLLGITDEQERLEIGARVHTAFKTSAHWALFNDVLPCFELLKERGLKISLISNWGVDLRPILADLPLNGYLDDAVISAEVKLHKPDPRIFLLALERLGIEAHEAVHVGDQLIADVEGAQAVGIMGVLLNREGTIGNYSITTLDELEGNIVARGGELPLID